MIVLNILLGLILGGAIAFGTGFGIATLFEHLFSSTPTTVSRPASTHNAEKPAASASPHTATEPTEKGTKR